MNLHKVSKIAAIVISILSILFLAGLMATSENDNNSWISPLIYMSYIVLIACIAIVLIYVIKNLFTDKENFKKTLISVGLFLGIFLISYLVADSSEVNANGEIISGSTSKLVSTGITMFYILGLTAIVTMAWTGLTKFKK